MDTEILELYLQCYSSRDIADKLEIDPVTVGNVLKNSIDGKMDIPDNLQLYNVWNVGRLSQSQLKYPGQTPQDIVENIIYYYTEPPKINPHIQISKVLDPMAGSGIVRDACKKLLRRYILYDVNPVREDIPIKQVFSGCQKEIYSHNFDLIDSCFQKVMMTRIENYEQNQYPDSTIKEFKEILPQIFKDYDKLLSEIKKLNKGHIIEVILPKLKEKIVNPF
jgi:hypothetical protein